MSSELVSAKRIYAVRPVNSRWLGHLPNSWTGNEDMKWEMLLNSADMVERDRICLIDKLLEVGNVSSEDYHLVDIIELEIQSQEVYFEYAAESKRVFDNTRQQALSAFEKASLWRLRTCLAQEC